MKKEILQIFIYFYFLSENIHFTYEQFNNNISDPKPLNKFIKFSKENIEFLFKFKLENNDLLIISIPFDDEKNRYIYGLRSNGENYYKYKNNTNYKTMSYSTRFNYLNGAIVKISEKEYPLICDLVSCELIDYENNIFYHKYMKEFFQKERLTGRLLSFQIINLTNEDVILFCISSDEDGILLRKIKILSTNLTHEQKSYFDKDKSYLPVSNDFKN